ncbi:MAG: hypothetical protein ACR2P6_07495, partial [Gammaproteobacteria bacterium]
GTAGIKSKAMNTSAPDWQQKCTATGLDPEDVRKVSTRYDMYKEYTDKSTAETLPLARWYKWYRIEKLSEGHAMAAPPVDGCSVTTSDGGDGPVVSEQEFLEILLQYRSDD